MLKVNKNTMSTIIYQEKQIVISLSCDVLDHAVNVSIIAMFFDNHIWYH